MFTVTATGVVPCGAVGQPCCTGAGVAQCSANLTCAAATSTCACGGAGQSCCGGAGGTCTAVGTVCGTSATCGAPTGNGVACETNLQCASGNCTSGICCAADQNGCGGTCFDTSSNALHCGAACVSCSGSTLRCLSGACVQCVVDQDCSGSTPSCDTTTHTCTCRRPSPGNLLQNSGFQASLGLGGWDPGGTPTPAVWSTEDADGCSPSGSAHAVDSGASGGPIQCVPATGGTTYFFGARFKATIQAYCQPLYFDDDRCLGTIVQSSTFPIINGFGTPAWSVVSSSLTTPTNARSIRLACFLGDSSVDQLYINAGVNSY